MLFIETPATCSLCPNKSPSLCSPISSHSRSSVVTWVHIGLAMFFKSVNNLYCNLTTICALFQSCDISNVLPKRNDTPTVLPQSCYIL